MKIKINFEYDKNRLNSLFYNGTVIEAENEECLLNIFTCGDVTIILPDRHSFEDLNNLNKSNTFENTTKYKNDNAIDELNYRKYTDNEIQKLTDADMIYENNWFEYLIIFKDDKETIYSNDVFCDIDECLETLNKFIKNDFDNF